jgi:hypothetical protein
LIHPTVRVETSGICGKKSQVGDALRRLVLILWLLLCLAGQAGKVANQMTGEGIGKNPVCKHHDANDLAHFSRLFSHQNIPASQGTAKDVINHLPPASGAAGGQRIFNSTCDAPAEDHFETEFPAALSPLSVIPLRDTPAHTQLGRATSTGSTPLRLIHVLLL